MTSLRCAHLLLLFSVLLPAAEEPIDRLASAMHAGEVFRNDTGTVIGFHASSHPIKRKKAPDKRVFTDSDVHVLQQYPELRILELEKAELSASGAQAIARMIQLQELELWSVQPNPISAELMQAFAPLTGLRKFDLKHNHADLEAFLALPDFPKLETLVLDEEISEAPAIAFIERHPNITELHLHRTSMTNDDFGRVIDALPKLERLLLKPRNQETGTVGGPGLAHLARAEHLSELYLAHQWDQMPWDDGLEHLIQVPCLRLVRVELDEALMQRLSEARPELYVFGRSVAFHDGTRYSDEDDKAARTLRQSVEGEWQAH